jgi:pimeloyl-ACP methyl ester carboxylesterase/thioredoxin reductase
MTAHTVAVVGAGPHGLSALKALLQAGFDARCFEQAGDLGGNWNFGAPTSRVYESTHLISSKPFTQFPDFPMPADFPDYPGHRQVKEYFDRYADHFGLRDRISFDTTVVGISPTSSAGPLGGPTWRVTTVPAAGGPETARTFDAVVIANGHNWNPKLPDYPGLAEFAGEILHSADYKSSDQLRGRRVLVVGAGNTGCDIAVEAAQNASATFHSTRRGYYYNPKYAFGRPSDQVADTLLALRIPLPVRRLMFKATLRATVGDLQTFGLRKPDHDFFETHPIVNQQLVYYVGHGDISPTPDIDHFDQSGAVFSDGSRADFDLVVFATGYLAAFPFLSDPEYLAAGDGRPRLGMQMASPRYRNLWVSGLIQPDSGQWVIAHWQGMAIASFLSLAAEDPGRAEDLHSSLIAAADRRFTGGADYKESTRHYYEIAHQDYLSALQSLLDRTTVGQPAPTVLRRWDWAVPPKSEHLEVLEVQPPDTRGGNGAERPPLLFLHGLGHGAWCYQEHWLAAAAERGFPAYALSFRGHGGSGGHTRLRRTLMRDYVSDVLATIAELPSAPVIVAHSLGTMVARRLLARYPARAGVLLTPMPAGWMPATVGVNAVRKPLDFARTLAGGTLPFHAADLFEDLDEATEARYLSQIGRESPWAQYVMLRSEKVPTIASPLLVVGAESDRLIAAADVRKSAQELGADLAWVPGGHDLMLDSHWRQALDVVLDWVDLTCPPGSAPLWGARSSGVGEFNGN